MQKKKSKKIIETTSNRGRPAKVFVSKKTHIKRDKPGRPRKEDFQSPQAQTIPEENKTKDIIILCLFIFSFLLFCFSLYVAQKKHQETITSTDIVKTSPIIEDTGTTQTIPETAQNEETSSISTGIINTFYTYLNKQQFTEINTLIDPKLKQTQTIRTYFTTKRLQRFFSLIDEKGLITTTNTTTTGDIKTIKYSLRYTLKNGSGYTENREATTSIKDNQEKITKLMCVSPGCSKLPFFNPGRYTK